MRLFGAQALLDGAVQQRQLVAQQLANRLVVAADRQDDPAAAPHPFQQRLAPPRLILQQRGHEAQVAGGQDDHVGRFVAEPLIGHLVFVVDEGKAPAALVVLLLLRCDRNQAARAKGRRRDTRLTRKGLSRSPPELLQRVRLLFGLFGLLVEGFFQVGEPGPHGQHQQGRGRNRLPAAVADPLQRALQDLAVLALERHLDVAGFLAGPDVADGQEVLIGRQGGQRHGIGVEGLVRVSGLDDHLEGVARIARLARLDLDVHRGPGAGPDPARFLGAAAGRQADAHRLDLRRRWLGPGRHRGRQTTQQCQHGHGCEGTHRLFSWACFMVFPPGCRHRGCAGSRDSRRRTWPGWPPPGPRR